MFFMSGDSTKEWYRYLCAGSRGWSILKLPPPLESVPVTVTLPSKKPARPELLLPWTPLPLELVPTTPSPLPLLLPATPVPLLLLPTTAVRPTTPGPPLVATIPTPPLVAP